MKNHFFNDVVPPDDNPMAPYEMSVFAQHWKWIFGSGIIYFILGFVAFNVPPVSSQSLAITLASLLVLGGLTLFSQALEFRHQRGALIRLFQSMLSFTIASMMFQYPHSGMIGLSLALSFYFLIGSIFNWLFFSEIRAHGGWSWGLISAITSFLLGLYIVAIFPFRELWAPGVLLGLDLMVSGSGMIGFSVSVQKYRTLNPKEIQRDQGLFPSSGPKVSMRR